MKWEHQIYRELLLNVKNQITPNLENAGLMIDFLYCGGLDELVSDLLIKREGKK